MVLSKNALLILASQDTLYVSKARGHDGTNGTNICQNMSTPCQTLSHAVNMMSGNDVIKLDPNNTAKKPYNTCPMKPIGGTLSFFSWSTSEIATINCSGKGLNFKGNNKTIEIIEFHNIKFLDTFLSAVNASLTINNCSFRSKDTEFLNLINAMNPFPKIIITNTIFLEKNNASVLNVVNNQEAPVFVEISNITVSKNYLKKTNYIISIQGYVNFTFANSEISNTMFSKDTRATLVSFMSCSTFGKQYDNTEFSVRGSNFSFNQGTIVHARFCSTANVSITDTRVSNNTAKFTQGAFVINALHETSQAAIKNNSSLYIDAVGSDSSITAGVTKLLVKGCVYLSNLAGGSGAISVAGNIACYIYDSIFHSNNGIHGPGAIDFSGTMLVIKNCTLDSNNGGSITSIASTLATGSVSLASGSAALIHDSKIIQRNAVKAVSNYGEFHGTLGLSSDMCDNVTLFNSTLDYEWSPSVDKVIVLEIAHTKNFVLKEGTTIKCPPGYKIRHSHKTSIVPPAQNFECELCTMGSYSIERGVYR